MINKVYHIDRMEFLSQYPDKYFDLFVDDPPYFSGPEKRGYYGSSVSTRGIKRRDYDKTEKWEVPGPDYFNEVLRVSKHQIIWGVNYFNYTFPSPGRIIWDKCNGTVSFSDCEIAYCSLHDSVRMFRYMWNGMMQGKSIAEGHIQQGNKKLNENRIHPTQKPVNLYLWTLHTYAKTGWKIGDGHTGSGSIRIAADMLSMNYEGAEKTEKIFLKQEKRYKTYLHELNKNPHMFSSQVMRQLISF